LSTRWAVRRATATEDRLRQALGEVERLKERLQEENRYLKQQIDHAVSEPQKELDYRLKKELWAYQGNRIAVRFEYEWHDDSGHWYRSYGNEQWEFREDGLMQRRFASINDLPITESERRIL
jgi:uncharacterized protein